VGTTTTLTTALKVPSGLAADSISYASFDEMMRQHQKRVYRVILLLVKDRDAADTLTQECFLRRIRKFRNSGENAESRPG